MVGIIVVYLQPHDLAIADVLWNNTKAKSFCQVVGAPPVEGNLVVRGENADLDTRIRIAETAEYALITYVFANVHISKPNSIQKQNHQKLLAANDSLSTVQCMSFLVRFSIHCSHYL